MMVERVYTLKCLGVLVSTRFSFSEHISAVLKSCSSDLFALYTLKTKGLNESMLNIAFKSIVLSKLMYASPFWWGFTTAADKERLEAFIRKSKRTNYFKSSQSFADLCLEADQKLFNKVLDNTQHVLHSYLPPRVTHNYNTRGQNLNRNFALPPKNTLRAMGFLTRLLYDCSY